MKKSQSQPRASMCESLMATVPALERNQNKSTSSPLRPACEDMAVKKGVPGDVSALPPGFTKCLGPHVILPDCFPAGAIRTTLPTLAHASARTQKC